MYHRSQQASALQYICGISFVVGDVGGAISPLIDKRHLPPENKKLALFDKAATLSKVRGLLCAQLNRGVAFENHLSNKIILMTHQHNFDKTWSFHILTKLQPIHESFEGKR